MAGHWPVCRYSATAHRKMSARVNRGRRALRRVCMAWSHLLGGQREAFQEQFVYAQGPARIELGKTLELPLHRDRIRRVQPAILASGPQELQSNSLVQSGGQCPVGKA